MPEETKTILGDAFALRVQKYRLTAHMATKNGPKQSEAFQKRVIFIGAHPDCDFCLNDSSISRYHAKIELDAVGYRLIDTDSKNGCYIGDLRVNDVYLTQRTSFRLGTVEIDFELGQEAVEVDIFRGHKFGDMLGESLAMREIFGLLARIAPTPTTVLIEGESGCGKELVAEAVHKHSQRADKPFVIFDCSAVSKDLIESELFGHVRGSFTGAVSDRKGAFLQANGGTLFLDEIGELSLDLQPKLLRVLESKEIRPVGGEKPIKLDVRVLAATNRSLSREVTEGNFREDLYYRLAVIRVELPPLRKRSEDIPLLVEHFLEKAASKFNSPAVQISFSTLQKLKSYRWPGNVRELKNFVERASLLTNDNRIETRFLNKEPSHGGKELQETEQLDDYINHVLEAQIPFKEAKQKFTELFETRYWTRILEMSDGNISKAARMTSMHRKSVEYIMRKLDLSAKDNDRLDNSANEP